MLRRLFSELLKRNTSNSCFSTITPAVQRRMRCRRFAFPTFSFLWTFFWMNLFAMFARSFCKHSVSSISQYNKHQISHGTEKNYKIKCMFSQCTTQSCSYSSFRQHITRYHKNVKEGFYFCKFFSNMSFSNIRSLKNHKFTHIIKSTNNTYSCGFCDPKKLVFTTINAYRIHMSRFHNNFENDWTISHEGNNTNAKHNTIDD